MWAAIAHTTGCMYTAVRCSPRPMHSGRDDAALHKAVYLSCLSAGVPTRSKKSAPRGWVLVLIWVADLPGGRTRQNGFLHRHPLHKSPPPGDQPPDLRKKLNGAFRATSARFPTENVFSAAKNLFAVFPPPDPPGAAGPPSPADRDFPRFGPPPKRGGGRGAESPRRAGRRGAAGKPTPGTNERATL